MKKIKFISILLAGIIITIDSVRAVKKEGEVENYCSFSIKENSSEEGEIQSIEDAFTKNEINRLKKIILPKTGTVEALIRKINDEIKPKFQVSSVEFIFLLLPPILLDLNLNLSKCPLKLMNNLKKLNISEFSFRGYSKEDELLHVCLVPKSDKNLLLNTKSKWFKYPRVYSSCVTTIFIFLIGVICLYHNPSALKGGELERKSSWKCRWKAINAMRLSRMLFFFLAVISGIFFLMQKGYSAFFGGYYYFLIDLIFDLLLLFLKNLRRNDAKLSKWWLVFFAVSIIYRFIVAIFSLKPYQIISQIIGVITYINMFGSLYLLFSPSISDEKKKAMKEEEKEEEEEEDDAFINFTTDIAN